jgi:hypothetical protein
VASVTQGFYLILMCTELFFVLPNFEVTLSHQDGHHSAVALLLKAALIQVSDYRLLGASGFFIPILMGFFIVPPTFKLRDLHQRFCL